MKNFTTNFKLVLISQIISLIGGNVLRFALILFILDMSNSAGAFGTVMAVSQIPLLIFSIPGGIIADRLNKKKLIVLLDGVKTVICGFLLFIFISQTYSIANLTLVITLFMTLVTLFAPILTAATPEIVDEKSLTAANGAIQSINAMSELLSFVLGGVLIATIGIVNIIILATILFAISTALNLFIKIPFTKQNTQTGIIKTVTNDLKEATTYATKINPFIIKLSLYIAVFAFILNPIVGVALPYIVRVTFEASDFMFATSQALSALGMLIGGVIAGKLVHFLRFTNFHKLTALVAVITLLLAVAVHLPLFPNLTGPFWLFNLAIMGIMIFVTFGNIICFSYIQEHVPTKYLGKTVALLITILSLAGPISQIAFGHLMSRTAHILPILFILIAILLLILARAAYHLFSKDSSLATLETKTT